MGVLLHLFPENYLSVEIQLNEEGSNFNYLILKRKGTGLEFIYKAHNVKNIEDVKKKLKAGSRIIITINGKGVLVRKLKYEGDINNDTIISKLLPNAKAKDFVIHSKKIDNENVFATVVRKDLITRILKQFLLKDCFVVDVIPGPLSIEEILPLLNINSPKILIDENKFLIQNNKITDHAFARYRKQEQSVQIAEEELNEKLLMAFAGCFQYITRIEEKPNSIPELKQNHRSMRYYEYYTKGKIAVAGILFLALLVNFLVFDSMGKRNEKLSSEISSYRGLIAEIENLQQKLSLKKELVNAAGLLNSSSLSYYTDRLVACMPEEIILENVSVFPAIKEKRTKQLSFTNNTIVVKGALQNPTKLNEWINDLKSGQWVEEVRIIHFNHNTYENVSNFEIEIELS